MRPLRLLLPVLVSVLAVPASATASASWAQEQIRTVVERGLMAPSVSRFRPNDPLTRRELGEALVALTQKPRVVARPDRRVTVRELDAALVTVLGLGPTARELRLEVAAAGLKPPRRLGTEVVARLLRLRYNHPAAEDGLELLPNDHVTRAEAAHSLARVLELTPSEVSRVQQAAHAFALPRPNEWQRRVLARAMRFVGFPYVWGGSSERAQVVLGVRSRGGFDCSGFVWRVYKLQPFAGAPALSQTLRGRTTYEMSGEMSRSARISLARLAPGDLVFFGEGGALSKLAEIGHMGIYVGGGWFVHSSSQGTTLAPLSGWYATTFAWGRRPLAEAGLA